MEENQGLDIKSILDKIQYFWKEVWKLKFWVVLSAVIFSGVFLTIAWLTPRYYPATLTFMVNSDEGGGGISSMVAVLGELGMGGSNGASNYEKIGALAKSRLIVERTLKTKVVYQDKEDYLGNVLMDSYAIEFDDEYASTISFNDTINLANTPGYDKVLKKLYELVVGKPDKRGLLAYDYDDESTVISLKAMANEPKLSILLANVHYDNLSAFYIANNTKKQENTFNQVAEKTDSIYNELRSAETQLARYVDASRGVLLMSNKLPRERLIKKVEMLYIMYGEVLKNKETAKFLLDNAVPYFQVVDTPIEPIQVQGKSRATGLIKGGLIGLLLGIGLIVGRRWLLDELSASS